MYPDIIRAMTRKKRGNIAIMIIIMFIVPFIVMSMVQMLTATESYQIRTIAKVADRYEDYSTGEVCAYKVIGAIDGKYLDELDMAALQIAIKNEAQTILGEKVQLELIDQLAKEKQMQLKIVTDKTKSPVIKIRNIQLIEEPVAQAAPPTGSPAPAAPQAPPEAPVAPVAPVVIRYKVNCATCRVERVIQNG